MISYSRLGKINGVSMPSIFYHMLSTLSVFNFLLNHEK